MIRRRGQSLIVNSQGIGAGILTVLAGALPIWCTSWSAEGFEYAKVLLFRAGLLIVCALWGISILRTDTPSARTGDLARSPVHGAVILFLAACAISTISSTLPWTSVFGAYENFMGLVTMAYFGAAFFVASRLLNTEERLRELIGMMRLAAVACAVAAVAERVEWDIFPRALAPDGRASGFFGNPNYLAGYLVMSLASILWSFPPRVLRTDSRPPSRVLSSERSYDVAVAGAGLAPARHQMWFLLAAILAVAFLGVWPPPISHAPFWLVLTAVVGGVLVIARLAEPVSSITSVAIILAGLIATGSRTGLAVAGLAMLIRLVSRAGGRPIVRLDKPLLFSGVIIVCLGTAIFRPVFTHFWSEWPRAAIWKSAVQMAKEHPWTGVGLDTFQQNFERHRGLYWNYEWGRTPSRAHSEPLHLLATTGLIGLAAYALVWGTWLWNLARRGRHSPASGGFSLPAVSPAARAATAALLAYGAFNLIHFPVAATAALFWILLGATSASDVGRVLRTTSRATPDVFPVGGAGLAPPRRWDPRWAWTTCLTLAIGGAAWHTVIRPARAELAYAKALRESQMSTAAPILRFREAVHLAPWEERYWTRLGAAALAAHEPAAALWAFEKAARLNPVGALPQMNLAHALALMGKPEDALRHAGMACDRDPQNVYLHLDRAQILEALGRRREADEVRRMARDLYPGQSL